jgi:hypothetical protein
MVSKAMRPGCLRKGTPERVEAAKLALPKRVQELVTQKVCLKNWRKKVEGAWTIHESEWMTACHVLPRFFIIASQNIITRNPTEYHFVIYSESEYIYIYVQENPDFMNPKQYTNGLYLKRSALW